MHPFPRQAAVREHTIDAIVVVPGAMGSALKDSRRGVIWGFTNPIPYVSLWSSPAGMTPLAFTPVELEAIAEGTYDPKTARVQPAGLIRFSAFAPVTGGFEPYTRLLSALKEAAAHPDAVMEFAYDWRLPTRLNSQRLAQAMGEHLTQWRTHEAHAAARRLHPEQRDAGIIIVAHSMGGLIARGLGDSRIDEGLANVRQVITLGTPFLGSVKAALMLAHGEGAPVPLPRQGLRDVAVTMPGIYDLLPRNRCLLTDDGGIDDVVALSLDDVADIGGDRQLAEAAWGDFQAVQSVSLPDHRPVAGIVQPTFQSLALRSGQLEPAFHSFRWDHEGELFRDEIGRPRRYDDQGDGTVWRYAARPPGSTVHAVPVPQQHGALANTGDAIRMVVGLVTEAEDLGVRLGDDDGLGLDVPDTVPSGGPLTITVSGKLDPSRVTCRVVDLSSRAVVRRPRLRYDGDDRLHDAVSLPDPGLYRVEAKGGAGDPVTQIVMVTPPE